MNPQQNFSKLVEYLYTFSDVAVAFSGGTDSSLLLCAAQEAHGKRAIAVTANVAFLTQEELFHIHEVLDELNIKKDARIPIYVLEDARIAANPQDRCYFCKSMILQRLIQAAKGMGSNVLMDGTNVDDLQDYRPGRKAAQELGIVSPLLELGFGKREIVEMLKAIGRPHFVLQPNACLATRIRTGEPITVPKLELIEEAEKIIRWYSKGIVRARLSEGHITVQTDEPVREPETVRTKLMAMEGVTAVDFAAYERSGKA